jgi:hypothetical protein
MTFVDGFVAQYADRDGWGDFVAAPAPLAADVNPASLVTFFKAPMSLPGLPQGENKIWNDIARRINSYPFPSSDQCSAKHYRDVFEFMRLNAGAVDRVVECGIFHGGMSVVLAGCAVAFDFTIDLVDVVPETLAAAYHRIRLIFPEALDRVRLFWGELPNYVKAVIPDAGFKNAVLHHDGSHIFNVVVRDLASLYYVRTRLHAILVQDTHLRHTNPDHYYFVDAAIAAVFGIDPRYQPIGTTFAETTAPDQYQRGKRDNVYFVGGQPEGMMLPLAENRFRYPHAVHRIDDFIKFPAKPPRLPADAMQIVAAEP